MGNRATVIFKAGEEISPAIYLHWNGGPESVYAFVSELNYREVRADGCYEAARFAQIVGEFFDKDAFSGTSLGLWNGPKRIDPVSLKHLDPGDNGIYVIDRTKTPNVIQRFKENSRTGKTEPLTDAVVQAEIKAAMTHKYNNPTDGSESIMAFRIFLECH